MENLQALLEEILNRYFKAFHPQTLLILSYDKPGAKYDPEGMAGIINIVLKENKFAGFNGNVNTGGDNLGGTNISSSELQDHRFNTFINLGSREALEKPPGIP